MIELKKMVADASIIEDIYANVNQENCLVQLKTPLPTDQLQQYLQAIEVGKVKDKPFICFGIYQDDAVVGKIELSRYEDGSAELDLVLKEEYCNQKIGREALNQLEEYVKENFWCKRIVAYVNEENEAMIHLLNACKYIETKPFKADIMVLNEGEYQLKTIQGIEFTKQLQQQL